MRACECSCECERMSNYKRACMCFIIFCSKNGDTQLQELQSVADAALSIRPIHGSMTAI